MAKLNLLKKLTKVAHNKIAVFYDKFKLNVKTSFALTLRSQKLKSEPVRRIAALMKSIWKEEKIDAKN